jgi:uncharacterized RDD family membrane protein YckC
MAPASGELTNRSMICPVCNGPYPCVHSPGGQAVSDTDVVNAAPGHFGALLLSSPATDAKSRADRDLWRQEVALRVRQHRLRRGRYDPNSSLDLDFPSEAPLAFVPDLVRSKPEFLQPMSEPAPPLSEPVANESLESLAIGATSGGDPGPSNAVEVEPEPHRPRKVIRFPKHVAAEPLIAFRPLIEEPELAEPAPEAPRILDAPEPEASQMELLPSFADITFEEAPAIVNLCEELESVPHPAALTRRLASGAVDSGIVLFAAGLFAACFGQIVEGVPSSRSVLFCAVAVGAILWLVFQYLFLVYGGATPGMRATELELFSFNGRRPSRLARRVRALATTLSAFSVGLGFAWALVDEDTLGWHDRISQTYLRSGDRGSGDRADDELLFPMVASGGRDS